MIQKGTESCVPGYGVNCNINSQKYYVYRAQSLHVTNPLKIDIFVQNRHTCEKTVDNY